MPTTYAHYRHGQNVYQRIKDHHYFDPKYMDLYNIGVHGPDIAFYYHVYNPADLSRIGYAMHHEYGDVLFDRFHTILNGHANKDAALAYLCGFICHYALDSTEHPIVYHYQHQDHLTHSGIEAALDRWLLKYDGINDPTKYDLTQHIHPTIESAAVIAPFFDPFTPQKIYTAIRSQVNIHHLLHCESDFKRNTMRMITAIPKGKFFEDLIMTKEDVPVYKPCVDDLLKHWNSAIDRAELCIGNYMDIIHGRTTKYIDAFHHDFEEN